MNKPIYFDGIIHLNSILKDDFHNPILSGSVNRRRPQTAVGIRDRGKSRSIVNSSKYNIKEGKSFYLCEHKAWSNKSMKKKSSIINTVWNRSVVRVSPIHSVNSRTPSKLSYYVKAYKSNIQRKYIKIKQLKEKKLQDL